MKKYFPLILCSVAVAAFAVWAACANTNLPGVISPGSGSPPTRLFFSWGNIAPTSPATNSGNADVFGSAAYNIYGTNSWQHSQLSSLFFQAFCANTNDADNPNVAFVGIAPDIGNNPFPSITLQGDGSAMAVEPSVSGSGKRTFVTTLDGVYGDAFKFLTASATLSTSAGTVIMHGDGAFNGSVTLSNAATQVTIESLATNNTPGVTRGNGSLIILTNGQMYVRSNNLWLAK